jgi:hypothetical protein
VLREERILKDQIFNYTSFIHASVEETRAYPEKWLIPGLARRNGTSCIRNENLFQKEKVGAEARVESIKSTIGKGKNQTPRLQQHQNLVLFERYCSENEKTSHKLRKYLQLHI